MKVILIISAVLAAAAISNAAPSPEIVAKVTEIRALVRKTLDEIEAVAIADDAVIGQRIKDKLEAEVEKAKSLLQQARELDSPTRAQAGEMLKKLLGILGDAKDAVKEDIKLLSEESQKTIGTVFKDNLTKAKEIAKSEISP